MAVPATITFIWPTVIQPTAVQARQHNSFVAEVGFINVDDTAVNVAHNMALPQAAGAKGIPKVSFQITIAGTVAVVPIITFIDANTINVAKTPATAANTTMTVRVTVERPAALTR